MTDQQDLSNAIAAYFGLGPANKFVTVTCAKCKQPIILPADTYEERLKDGRPFQCYQGHGNYFGDSENDRLKKEVADLKTRIQELEKRTELHRQDEAHCYELWSAAEAELKTLKRQTGSYKTQITKLKKKLAAGQGETP